MLTKEKETEYDAKLTEIFSLLGMKRKEQKGDHALFRSEGYAPDGSGVFIWIKTYGGDTGKACITGIYPKDKQGESVRPWGYSAEQPAIRVSLERSAKAIAGDIRRRLLPEYQKMLEIARRQVKESDDYAQQCRRTWLLLSVEPPEGGSNEARLYDLPGDVYGSARVSGNSVRLQLSGLTPEQAARILDIARESND